MSDFGIPVPAAPAKRGNVIWTLRLERMPNGEYVPEARGKVEYLDASDTPIAGRTVQGNLLNHLTSQEKNQIRNMMDRISAIADAMAGLT